MNPEFDNTTALGIDIGGTRVRVGIVRNDGRIIAQEEGRLPAEGAPEALGQLVAQQMERVIAHADTTPERAGVALPGVWDPQTGVMKRAVNLPRLEGVNLYELFHAALGRNPRLEADVNAGVWGQWRVMQPRPTRLVYLSLGTGVGGSAIFDGQIVRHTRGGAGHFGFLIVDTSPDAPAGRNDVPGCLSAIAAGPALHLAATGSTDPEAIGDEALPEPVIDRAASALAIAFMNLVHIYAPDTILLGGGVIDHHPEIVERTRTVFGRYRSKLIPAELQIVQAPLTTHEAGVIGAALLALD